MSLPADGLSASGMQRQLGPPPPNSRTQQKHFPAGHAANVVHTPPQQRPPGQTTPHPPQLLGSTSVVTHSPLQSERCRPHLPTPWPSDAPARPQASSSAAPPPARARTRCRRLESTANERTIWSNRELSLVDPLSLVGVPPATVGRVRRAAPRRQAEAVCKNDTSASLGSQPGAAWGGAAAWWNRRDPLSHVADIGAIPRTGFRPAVRLRRGRAVSLGPR